jgi:hypothetical protein
MDGLVMNWLIVEGYADAAAQFQQEARSLKSTAAVPLESIAARTAVRTALSQGRVEEAMRDIDALVPTLLQKDPALALQLKQQQLVELIRAERIEDALTYARTHLRAGSAHEAPALQALESIMSLLAFSSLPAAHNPMAHLLDQRARNLLASAVNDAILEGQFACKESGLQRTAKQALYAQNQINALIKNFPTLPLDPTANAAGGASGAGGLAAAGSSSAAASSAPAAAAPSSSSASSNGLANGQASASAASPASAAAAGSSSASVIPPLELLDPAPHFEALASREALVRRAAEAAASRELGRVRRALERQRKAQRREARRQMERVEALRAAGMGMGVGFGQGPSRLAFGPDAGGLREHAAAEAVFMRQMQRVGGGGGGSGAAEDVDDDEQEEHGDDEEEEEQEEQDEDDEEEAQFGEQEEEDEEGEEEEEEEQGDEEEEEEYEAEAPAEHSEDEHMA